MKKIFEGSCTALITPFTKNGKNIDFKNFEKQIKYQLENKTDALLVLGTTGEASTLTLKEKTQLIEFAIKTINKKVPLLVGVGTNSTTSTLENIKHFQKYDVDAFLVVTPYYNKCTQKGLIKHFETIANHSSKPIILYSVPSRTGVNILPATVKHLSKHKNIVGIKEASGNITQILEIARLVDDNFAIYSGDDGLILPILSVGGSGVISVASNVAPKLVAELNKSFFGGDILYSRALQKLLNPLVNALFVEVNPIPVKFALKEMGLDSGILRLPLTKLERKNQKQVIQALKNLYLIES